MSESLPLPISVNIVYIRDAKEIYKNEGLRYETPGAAGLDLRACIEEEQYTIQPGERQVIPCGIAIEPLTTNIAGFIYSRSGIGAIHGLIVAQGVGVIDPDYRGEIIVILLNTSQEKRYVNRGDRIAQLVFQPAFQVLIKEKTILDETCRGESGFGHTGEQ